MEQAEYDRSLERFQAFLNTEPVIPILSRNLAFLLDENRAVETVEVDASLHCRTEGRKVVVSAAPYLMCDGYDRRHWLAAMRVLLAHEVQHDNSSDRRVLAALRSFAGNRLHETAGIPFDAGGAIGQRLLNALEDARVDNRECSAGQRRTIPPRYWMISKRSQKRRRAVRRTRAPRLKRLFRPSPALHRRRAGRAVQTPTAALRPAALSQRRTPCPCAEQSAGSRLERMTIDNCAAAKKSAGPERVPPISLPFIRCRASCRRNNIFWYPTYHLLRIQFSFAERR